MNKTVCDYHDFIWTDIEAPEEADLQLLDPAFEIDKHFFEDAMEAGHLPKFERAGTYTFMIMRAYTAAENEKAIEVGQISNKIAFFINEKGLLTIHRAYFEFIHEHFQKEFKSVDELALSLVNDILHTFERPLRKQADKMDELERQIFIKHGQNLSIESLYYEKAKARLTKKILLISQNIIGQFKVKKESLSNLQDLKDTILDFILKSDEIIDDSNALLNSYMSFAAQKSNDVMKLLTVFSAFFLPLTFIAGVYGMNFDNMPELRWEYSYFITIGAMLLIALVIYIWFKRKKIL